MSQDKVYSADRGISNYFVNIYSYLSMGIALMGSVAFFMASSWSMIRFAFALQIPVAIAVMFIPFMMRSVSVDTARMLYWLYAGLFGLLCTPLLVVYTTASVANAFFSAAAVFMIASYYGYYTDTDLSKYSSVLFIGIIGVVGVSLMNLILQSSLVDIMLSSMVIVISTGIVAFDTQRLKSIYYHYSGSESDDAIAIFGALMLLCSFVNIFTALLRLGGTRRE